MRKIANLAALAVIAALLIVSAAPALAGHGKSHKENVEVVSVDVAAKTITLKDAKGETKTAPVMGDAVAQLEKVKAGDKVTVECHDDENGAHKGVTAIHKQKM
jgi:hypothetical protein